MVGRLAWAGLIACGIAATAAAQEPPPTGEPGPPPTRPDVVIQRIEFEGQRHASKQELLALMATKEKGRWSPAMFEEDVRRLGLSGFLVTNDPEPVDGVLRIRIDERPKIRGIDVKGTSSIAESDVRQAVGLRVSDPLMDDVLLERVRDNVRLLYRQRAHHFAEVTVTTQSAPRGVRVVVKVDEGPKTAVKRVNISGAHGIALDELLGLMQTEASSWFQSRYLDPAKLKLDAVRLQRHYRERGWLDARVTRRPLAYSPDGSTVTVSLHVAEGRRYRLEDVRIEGAEKIPAGTLYDLLQTPLNQPLDAREVFGDPPARQGDRQRLKSHYEAKGYFDAEITPEIRILDPAAATVEVVYRIRENSPSTIGRIDITGNRITRERVVRRFLPFAPGEKLRTDLLQLGFLRLMQSRYFTNVRIVPRNSLVDGYKDLLIDVEESERNGQLQFGGAFNQSLGLQGQFQMEIQNFDIAAWSWPWNLFRPPHFRGGGQSLKLAISAGGRAANYSITFREPRFLDTRFDFSLSGQISNLSQLDYDVRRQGGTIGFARSLTHWMGVGLSWTGQFVETRNVAPLAPPELLALETLGRKPLSKLRARLNLDWVDRDIGRRPYRGFELTISGEVAHKSLGSFWNFFSIGVRPQFHWTLFGDASKWRHVITFRTGVDYSEPIEGDSDVPFFERFFAGGFGTIRGFDFRDVGPRVNNRPIGGRILATGTLEYSLPLYRDTLGGNNHIDIIRLVAFFDFGTLLRDWKDYNSGAWRSSIGFGFRLNPLGFPVPFALDFGWALKREDTDDRELISVTFDVRF